MVYLPNHHRFTTRDFIMPQRSHDQTSFLQPFLITKKTKSGVIVPCIDTLGFQHAGHAFKKCKKQNTKHVRFFKSLKDFVDGKMEKEGTTQIGAHLECKQCGMIRILPS